MRDILLISCNCERFNPSDEGLRNLARSFLFTSLSLLTKLFPERKGFRYLARRFRAASGGRYIHEALVTLLDIYPPAPSTKFVRVRVVKTQRPVLDTATLAALQGDASLLERFQALAPGATAVDLRRLSVGGICDLIGAEVELYASAARR
eukprot:gnl/Chilomastix_cuspidata/4947.p1 GENE.gnl/Chilomastix_cuspidata/4947~~gnl/Chilomastix_cuspidata/4947.p1  ORF type:complete len:150 (+),score=56.49 gnl/Chilomastix_cuspidata/4947:272-721(+)